MSSIISLAKGRRDIVKLLLASFFPQRSTSFYGKLKSLIHPFSYRDGNTAYLFPPRLGTVLEFTISAAVADCYSLGRRGPDTWGTGVPMGTIKRNVLDPPLSSLRDQCDVATV